MTTPAFQIALHASSPHATPTLRRTPFALACCALMLANGAQAQSAAPARQLDAVTITANPLGTDDLIAPVSSLSGQDLMLRSQSSLGETLDGMPGVSSTYFGPSSSRPVIRGQDGDRIRILNHGGAGIDASALSFDHAVPIDPLSIERVEVLRGPGALQYGGSAVGGVVNVINNRIPEEAQFDASGGIGGRAELRAGGASNERAGSALLETGSQRFGLHVDAFERTSADVRVPVGLACDKLGTGVATVTERLCNSASRTSGAAVGATAFFDRGYLGASVETFKTDYGSVAEDAVTIGMKQNRLALKGELRGLGGPVQSVKAQWSAVNYQHTEFDAGAPGTVFRNKGQELRVEARQAKLGRLDGVIGLQLEGNRFSADGEEAFVPYTRSASEAMFAHEELRTGWGKLSFGARLESAKVESLGNPLVDRFALASRRFHPASFALGGLLNLGTAGSGWTATGNVSATQRAPKDYELYANGAHLATGAYERGNASLAVERSTNADIGLAWKQGPERFSVNGFFNQFGNYISLESTGNAVDVDGTDFPEYAFRQVKARFVGMEANGSTRLLGGAKAAQTLDLELKADLVRATNLSTGQAMPRIAPLRLGAALKWKQGPWGAHLGMDHYAAQNRVPSADRATGAYTFWNADATYRMDAGMSNLVWFARLENIGNRLAYSASSVLTQTAPNRVPLPGRGFKVGLRASF